jgi:hypothetical protein
MSRALSPKRLVVKNDKNKKCLGFEDFKAVVMKRSIFWDITPCNPLKDGLLPAARWFLVWLIFRP